MASSWPKCFLDTPSIGTARLLGRKTVCPLLHLGWLALHCTAEGYSGRPSRSSSQENEPWIIIQRFSSGLM